MDGSNSSVESVLIRTKEDETPIVSATLDDCFSVDTQLEDEAKEKDSGEGNAEVKELPAITLPPKKLGPVQRLRRRILRFLNSHHVLIIICVLVVLDAAMVIGQLMIDLYIIREKFAKAEDSLFHLVGILRKDYPSIDSFQVNTIEDLLHAIEHGQQQHIRLTHDKQIAREAPVNENHAPSSENLLSESGLPRQMWNYKRKRDTSHRNRRKRKRGESRIRETFDDVTGAPIFSTSGEGRSQSSRNTLPTGSDSATPRINARVTTPIGATSNHRTTSLPHTAAVISHETNPPRGGAVNEDGGNSRDNGGHGVRLTGYTVPNVSMYSDNEPNQTDYSDSKLGNKTTCDCVFDGNSTDKCVCDHHDHLMMEIAHSFHLASLCILTLMTLEKFMKGLCVGEVFLKKKMEIFDSFVVVSSLILDIVFLQGIWSTAEKDAALFLVCLLPWRVIRIVNCFVMTMKQRHYIRMQLQKHARRKAQKKVKLFKKHLERLKRQIKSLKGLCRKHGAEEREINACAFVFTESRRRKSSLPVNAMSTMASLALIGVIGNDPHMPRQEADIEDVDLDTLDERDEDELDELAEVENELMPGIEEEPAYTNHNNHSVHMNGNCHRDRKVSTVSGTDSIEISCGSVSFDDSGSPTLERRNSNDSIVDIDLGAISDESYAETGESDGDNRKDDKILKSRRFSTTDFLYSSKKSFKKRNKKGK
ncbi:uncharacterized protein LOC135492405 isoform X2 [Lineus longissimus]|uniref:uncharacterized protein LOC135492405 isoform X2 n=1 Tax=Lineus longissimus TaxID=88925 RepID=UPI002B4DD305